VSVTSPEAVWLASSLAAARPRVISALLRVFRDLDTAEEAFQEASLRALRTWPRTGPPRDVAAWLILVGRNAALDGRRRLARQVPLPADDGLPERAVSDQGLSDPGLSNLGLSDLEDAETPLAEAIDAQVYRDEILRLLFICCHPDLPVTQQIALALRIVAGLSVARIARAFLVSEAAMEQRITRAKARIARSAVPYGAPGAVERVERLAAVSAMLYLVFNAGYSAATGSERSVLCDEAIRLGRLLLRLFSTDPEVMGLLALMLLQHARSPARVDADGEIVLLEDQDRGLWRRPMIAEGLALVDKAMRHRRPGPYQVQAAIAALHARARRPQETDWAGIDALYAALERMQPSPVVTLNRAVATAKVAGPAAGLALVEPLAGPLQSYVHFHGLRGALLMQLGRNGEAREAMRRAIALAGTPAEAAHLRSQLDRLAGTGAAESEKI
jgi:RNA polymerase sigma-70 factor (ECF subfamily)